VVTKWAAKEQRTIIIETKGFSFSRKNTGNDFKKFTPVIEKEQK
jgi:hypothetical protein